MAAVYVEMAVREDLNRVEKERERFVVGFRERARERERERDRHNERKREGDRQADRQTETETDRRRQTDRDRPGHTTKQPRISLFLSVRYVRDCPFDRRLFCSGDPSSWKHVSDFKAL